MITSSTMMRDLPNIGQSRIFTNAMTGKSRLMKFIKTEHRAINHGKLRDGTAVIETHFLAHMEAKNGWKELWEIISEIDNLS